MGIGDMINKAKDALGNEEESDKKLDQGADFLKGKISGHDDKIDKVRDAIDGQVGDERAKP